MKFLLYFNFLRIGVFFVLFLFVCCENPTKIYTSYRPLPVCSPSEYMRYPTNTDEVVAIVKDAISRNLTIKAFAARHSQTDIICTEGIPVDMSNFKFCKMNPDNVTATFGPGITLREAGECLLKCGRSLGPTPLFGEVTLGGVIGTGAHGSSLKHNSAISEQVVKMTIIDGEGNKQVISDPEELRSFKVHLGLLGVVVDITLLTLPLYKVLAHNYVVSDEILTNGVALEYAKTTDQIMFYWFPTSNQVVVSNLTFVPANTTGEAWTNILPPTSDLYNIIATKSINTAYDLISTKCAPASALGYTILRALEELEKTSLHTQVIEHVPYFTEDGKTFKKNAVGNPHLMFTSNCSDGPAGPRGTTCIWDHGDVGANITFVDNFVNIALNNISAFITTAKDIVSKTPTAFPLHGIIFQFANESDSYMSTSYKTATAAIGFLLLKSSDPNKIAGGSLAGYQTILQVLTKTFYGRSHWGKSGLVYHNSEMLDMKLDPIARQKFIASMKKYDPNGIFLNDFGRRITKTGTKVNSDPLATHCALLDNCFCSKDSDCADSQTCTFIPGYNDYKVCKSINESPQQVDKNSFPPVPDLLNWLNTTVSSLVTAVLNMCPLDGLVDGLVDGLAVLG